MTKFHILDVLSITSGKLLSLEKMDGLYKILNFLTGEDLYTHQLIRASKTCKPYLLKTYPVLVDPLVESAIGNLSAMLSHLKDTHMSDEVIKLAIKGWAVKYVYPVTGEYIEILPLDTAYAAMNPVDEMGWQL